MSKWRQGIFTPNNPDKKPITKLTKSTNTTLIWTSAIGR